MTYNPSPSVTQYRHEPSDSLDYFPTPPWATRALCETVIEPSGTVLEPACGEGHMVRPLTEYFNIVIASDICDYGYGEVIDYLDTPMSSDWVITNPPFNLAADFIHKACRESTTGVAMILRSAFIESVGRYNSIFRSNPPSIVAPFAERVAMVKGRLDRKAGTATSYSWFIWLTEDKSMQTSMKWIEPCKRLLDKDDDWSPKKTSILN